MCRQVSVCDIMPPAPNEGCTSSSLPWRRRPNQRCLIKDHIRQAVEAPANKNIPDIKPGDSVAVHLRIREGGKERVQEFKGTVIKTRGSSNNASFTVRRIASHGVGVERTFLLRSPRIEKVTVMRRSKVRRAKLYYMRGLKGKKARLKEKRTD